MGATQAGGAAGGPPEGLSAADWSSLRAAYEAGRRTEQQAYLKPFNPDVRDNSGWSLAVSGDTVVVGARAERSSATGVNGNRGDNSEQWAGAAYAFARTGTIWGQRDYLKASNAERFDGHQGNVEPFFEAGAAYVFLLEAPE